MPDKQEQSLFFAGAGRQEKKFFTPSVLFARPVLFFSSTLLIQVTLFCLVFNLSACVKNNGFSCPEEAQTWNRLVARGANQGLTPYLFDTGMFHLSGLLRIPQNKSDAPGSPNAPAASEELIIYLEGDGRIFDRQGKVRDHATPDFAQACELALQDPAPALLYLARPGQFNFKNRGQMFQKYWTNARLAPEVVQSVNRAIEQVKLLTGAKKLQIIGYSGRGALACLLAARRSDVSSLITVAALLDTAWWTEKHLPAGLENSLNLSLNPIDGAAHFSDLPQIHMSGRRDRLVPPQMVGRLQQAADFTNFRQLILDNTHSHGWTEAWPDLLKRYLIPLRTSEKEYPVGNQLQTMPTSDLQQIPFH